MDSSAALVQTASKLEYFMSSKQTGILKESMTAQISALLYYKASVIAGLTTNKGFQQTFSKIIFDQINKDFGEYIDALARSRPKSLHHVYEWNKTGLKTARLFELKKINQESLSFKVAINYKLSKSTVPNSSSKRRHVFANKAEVMEAGMPLVIRPRYAQRLVFEMYGEKIFMPKGKSVTVKRPGGSAVKNQFSLSTSRFFNGNLINSSIKRSGFQNVFNTAMTKALSTPATIKSVKYSFSPNSIRMQAEANLASSFGGVM